MIQIKKNVLITRFYQHQNTIIQCTIIGQRNMKSIENDMLLLKLDLSNKQQSQVKNAL